MLVSLGPIVGQVGENIRGGVSRRHAVHTQGAGSDRHIVNVSVLEIDLSN